MNETLMTALGTALTAAQEALDAAQAGDFVTARNLLAIMDEHLEDGQGGNAAHAARRRKILRLESETRALFPEEAPVSVDVDVEAQPADAPVPAPVSAPRGVAPAQHLSAEAWALVAVGLSAEGQTAEALDAQAVEHEAAQTEASAVGRTYEAKVARRLALQAQAEAAALRGDVQAANDAWDRLFDVVTALRGAEGKARRKGEPSEELARNYHAAREDTLKVRRWARGLAAV